MICDKCGYDWEYGGELKRATCPSCGIKVDVINKEVKEE